MPNGDIYFHRYNHDNYCENNNDCTGWPAGGSGRYGRFWPVLSGERGEYEIGNGRSATVYLQSMADAANDGYFLPEQIWDRPDIACFTAGRPTGSAAPLNWAEGQYLRLAQSIDAGYNLDTLSVVKAQYRGAGSSLGAAGKCIDDARASTDNGATIQLFACNGTVAQNWVWNSDDGTLRALNKCWTSLAARLPAERHFSSGTATAQAQASSHIPRTFRAVLPPVKVQVVPPNRAIRNSGIGDDRVRADAEPAKRRSPETLLALASPAKSTRIRLTATRLCGAGERSQKRATRARALIAIGKARVARGLRALTGEERSSLRSASARDHRRFHRVRPELRNLPPSGTGLGFRSLGEPSERILGRYLRRVADLPCSGAGCLPSHHHE